MGEINNIEWKERKRMSDFLYRKGWQLTKDELWNVIQEYHLKDDWAKENLTKHNSSVIQDCEMLIGYKSLKDRQDRLNELKKKWEMQS